MEHWDHVTCEAFTAMSAGAATAISGIVVICLLGAFGFGLI